MAPGTGETSAPPLWQAAASVFVRSCADVLEFVNPGKRGETACGVPGSGAGVKALHARPEPLLHGKATGSAGPSL